MTKKIFFSLRLLLTVGMATVVFNSCGQDEKNAKNNSATTDAGVVINGVKWATRDVDAPGTFAATPESTGMFYQWNRKTAWSATEPDVGIAIDNWDTTLPAGTTWEKANDPSPQSWRVPTHEELLSLLDESKVKNEWVTQNGITGRRFTDKVTGNTLFLPAAGYRHYGSDGALKHAGERGFYWSSKAFEAADTPACFLFFFSGDAGWYINNRREGLSIRAVAE